MFHGDPEHTGAYDNGGVLWTFPTGMYVTSTPALYNGLVYVGSWDDNVYALNAATGTLIWKYKTGSVVDSSPAIVNGIVYIGGEDGNVYALNAYWLACVELYCAWYNAFQMAHYTL